MNSNLSCYDLLIFFGKALTTLVWSGSRCPVLSGNKPKGFFIGALEALPEFPTIIIGKTNFPKYYVN